MPTFWRVVNVNGCWILSGAFQHLLRCPMLFIPHFVNMDCQGMPYPFFFFLFFFLFSFTDDFTCCPASSSSSFHWYSVAFANTLLKILCFASCPFSSFVLSLFLLVSPFLYHLTETIISTKFCHYYICFIISSQNWSWNHFFSESYRLLLKVQTHQSTGELQN